MKKKFLGISLIEVLVTMTISLSVMAMAFSIYMSLKKEYNKNTTQMNSTYVKQEIDQIFDIAITHAGFRCGSKMSENSVLINDTRDNISFIADETNGVMPNVYFGVFASTNDEAILGNSVLIKDTFTEDGHQLVYKYKPDTNFIAIQKGLGVVNVLENTAVGSTTLKLDLTKIADDLQVNDYLLICKNSSFMMVQIIDINFTTGEVTLQNPLSVGVSKDSVASLYSLNIYYIGDSGKKDKDNQTIYSLYLYILRGESSRVAYELVSNFDELDLGVVS